MIRVSCWEDIKEWFVEWVCSWFSCGVEEYIQSILGNVLVPNEARNAHLTMHISQKDYEKGGSCLFGFFPNRGVSEEGSQYSPACACCSFPQVSFQLEQFNAVIPSAQSGFVLHIGADVFFLMYFHLQLHRSKLFDCFGGVFHLWERWHWSCLDASLPPRILGSETNCPRMSCCFVHAWRSGGDSWNAHRREAICWLFGIL